MFELSQIREPSESEVAHRPEETERSVADAPLFRLGRFLFGGVLAFMALDNVQNLDERIGYAESKDAPFPSVSVPAVSTSLLFGSVGVALWRYPSAAAAAVASFFIGVTPVMHDFWNLDDPEQKQQQFLHFLKNTALLGAALSFMKVGEERR